MKLQTSDSAKQTSVCYSYILVRGHRHSNNGRAIWNNQK